MEYTRAYFYYKPFNWQNLLYILKTQLDKESFFLFHYTRPGKYVFFKMNFSDTCKFAM